MSRRLTVLVVLACTPGFAAQQAPATSADKTGLILGRVVDGASGRPVSGVTVTLSGAPPIAAEAPPGLGPGLPGVSRPTSVLTSDEGYFVFHGLPEGAYAIGAVKPGYLRGAHGRRSPAQTGGTSPVRLKAGERKGDVTITLWKYGVIAGTVVDERGEPFIGIQVRVLRRRLIAGTYRLEQTGNMPTTDDRGAYRIASLEPGDYVAAVVNTPATVPTTVQEDLAKARASGNYDVLRDMEMGGSSGGVRIGSSLLRRGSQGPGGDVAEGLLMPPPGRGPLFVYPTIYHPSASTPAQAGLITVRSGEERGNIDFQLKPVPSVSVSGTVTGPSGPVPMAFLQLLAAGYESLQREYSFEAATTVCDAAGHFTFLGVTPGQYVIRVIQPPARPTPPSSAGMTTVIQAGNTMIMSGGGPSVPLPIPDEPTYWATQTVAVGESDTSGVSVTLQTGARIGGRVDFSGTAEKPPADRLQLMTVLIEPSDGRAPGGTYTTAQIRTARFDANGVLKSYQQPAGHYILRPGAAAPGWSLASVMLDGVDVSATPFELRGEDLSVVVKYTDTPSELSGVVRDAGGKGDAQAMVLVFPADARAWAGYGFGTRRFQTARADDTGSFRVRGLADGDYLAVAVPDDLVTEWRDPVFLRKLTGLGTRVKMTEGQKAWVDLKLSAVR
jgi:hypothetical protein